MTVQSSRLLILQKIIYLAFKSLDLYKKIDKATVIFSELKKTREFHLHVKETQLFDKDYFFRCVKMSPVVSEG